MDKFERKIILEQQKRIKPGECHKYIRVLIDVGFTNGPHGSKIIGTLGDMNFKYEIQNNNFRIILWERSDQQFLVSSNDKISLSDKNNLEKHILFLVLAEEFIESVRIKTLNSIINDIINTYEGSIVTLLIFGFKNYCKSNKCPVKQDEIGVYLTELQIFHNCCHRFLETPDELALTVGQFSKAVAEIPFKKQQSEKPENACFFLENDNKDCVRVEGSAGLTRLWQQHLTRLPHITLETTDAIINEYPQPKSLIEAYERETDGSKILENLKLRKSGHPISSGRRIGPELSRKIYTLYTSSNPDEIL